MKNLVYFVVFFVVFYGCKERDNLEFEGELKSTCDFPSQSESMSGEEWHFYFLDSEEYPLFHAIINGEKMDIEKWRDFVNSGKCYEESFRNLCRFLFYFPYPEEPYTPDIIFEAPFFVLANFTEPFSMPIYEGNHFKMYKMIEFIEKILNHLPSFSPQRCDNFNRLCLDECCPYGMLTFCSSSSKEGCVFDIHPYYFKGINECTLRQNFSHVTSPPPSYPAYYDEQKGWVEKCYKNISYKGKFYPEGLSAPKETVFEGLKGKFWIGRIITENGVGGMPCDGLQVIDYFLWESFIRDKIAVEVLSIGMEEMGPNTCMDGRFPVFYFPPKAHLYFLLVFLKIKGENKPYEIMEGLNFFCSEFNCEKGERIDRCIYSQLKMEEVYSCLERGKKRINEDGALFPFFSASDYWCDNHKDCPYEFFERSFFYPPISCAPGYPFSSE